MHFVFSVQVQFIVLQPPAITDTLHVVRYSPAVTLKRKKKMKKSSSQITAKSIPF